MLASALQQESDSVFVDLLTYSDLETLKSKKSAGRAPLQRTIPPNNKRYLILTYAAEFDRVHYPLPLLYEEPTIEHLQSVVQQLRSQLAQSAPSGGKPKHSESAAEVRRLRDENCALQLRLGETEQQARDNSLSSSEQLQMDHAEAQQEVTLVRTLPLAAHTSCPFSTGRANSHGLCLVKHKSIISTSCTQCIVAWCRRLHLLTVMSLQDFA